MSDSELPASVKFHYIKGNSFRVIHVDGTLGGITPSRNIFLTLFSERGALPRMIEKSISTDGTLGDEIGREGRDGIVREMDVGIVLTVTAAQDLADFLEYQIKLLNESVQERSPDTPATETQ